jgi:hypothetical protein
MRMLSFVAAAGLAAVATTGLTAASRNDPEITVTGCIVRGQDGGFLIADLGARTSTAAPAATIGTTGKAARVLYLLKDDDDWKEHAGHRVELTGEVEGKVEEGKIEVERKDDGIDVEIESDGRKVKALLPHWTAGIVSDKPVTEKEVETKYLVHKIDVKHVKMLGDCR